jgi:putative membrane-bound dehydrogenase-like protein
MNYKPACYSALSCFAALSLHGAETLVPASMFTLSDPDLEVTVWATSPMLRNPTNMDVDKDGRIWIAEGVRYRSHANRLAEGDRIMVLEDTDGDGKADSSHVFVQDPAIQAPLGIAVIDNKIIVSQSPDMIVYTDVNRDRKFDPAVDKREVLLTGFNGFQHDHSLHSVTVGPDGQWYWNAGNCGANFTDRSGKTFRIGSAYGDGGRPALFDPTKIAGQKSDDGHVWVGGFAARMNPDGTMVNIIGHNFRNSYEQTVTSFGDVFQNDNDDPPACRTSFLLEFGNAGFNSFDGLRSWGADRRPGQSVPVAEWRQEDPGSMPPGDVYGGGSPTGIAFVEDSALGEKYRGLLLSCEPGRNVVFGYFPKPDGAGYKLERFDFLTSNKEKKFAGTDFLGGRNDNKELATLFRPSDVTVGADGAIYVADWFDPRVGGHGDWDDSTSGTIYRVAPKGFKPVVPKVDLTTLEGSLAALKSPAVNIRGAAQEAIMSKTMAKNAPGAVTKPVAKLLKDENPYVRARAIWLLSRLGDDGIDKVESTLKGGWFSKPDDMTRVVAFRALRRQNHNLLEHAAKLATDKSPAVRREVALAMRDLPFDQSKDILLALAKGYDGEDRTYLEAWGTGCSGKEEQVYAYIKPKLNAADPIHWTAQVAGLAWRLHVPESIADFRTRALDKSLSTADRKAATTALGYNASKPAAEAMLDVAAGADGAVKAEAIWWLLNRKGGQWKDHDLDAALKERGIYNPDNVEILPVSSTAPEAPKYSTADVAKLRGDAQRGSQKVSACVSCHRIAGTGVDFAPDLTGWASRQTTEVLINAVIKPSDEIAHGFEASTVKLKNGDEIDGIVLTDRDPTIVVSAGGLTQMVPRNRVASIKGLGRSLMLSADQMGLTPQDLADIAAYLKTK